ncbi:MAG: ABC-F family ATP-binding cassette domain-containing protein [Acidimicrobiia bacterium]|nr:ATP-binding cassette domain-containing protein [Acidimicrobiia bacterium]NNF87322.1 ABC-F family ATP-binding cassette domain-containing protein [Acidimicrobiia bacterium]NNJ48397.1 ABC-F family ATP-binding cassette domain-containing protein [Acidimicrobiia bacterium]NNL12529.1 ABC-F family ATP-binding cassette domain-containing protein [Acidimicrobiia bacterium]RZV42746.1 MAG: ABC-F family ATP-binding cassette domain-containing protein [Acidimicrobiia bacterium]
MILARDLTIEAGIRTLVSGASLNLQPGDKVGLVGRNGAGKTTLMRTLAGELNPADGHLARSGVIGYLSQESALPELDNPDLSALERILTARDIGDLEVQIEEVRRKMAVEEGDARDRLIRRYDRLRLEFETRGGYAAIAEAKKFAASVGIETGDLDQPVATMSGGQRRRVELARVLFQETDTLLLDEPTNHIDLDAKSWLMDWLAGYAGGLLVVSHDLQLLDESITSVLAVDDGKLEPYRGNYTYYLAERDRRREQRIRERKHQDEKIARLEEGIRRFKGTTEKMARRAHTWETRVNRMRSELTEVSKLGKNITVRFPMTEPSGRIPLEGKGLGKAFDDNVVFLDVDVFVERGQRLLIMGLNGAGKTTLLRILAGVDQADLGAVVSGHNATLGYYAQEHEQIERGRTVFDHVKAVSSEPDQTLRSVLGHFLLADKVDQDAGTLSGGEKTKLALCQVVLGGPNVMLLDEPTNNLDPQAQSALLEALHNYPGTIILVSHDTDFVARLEIDRAILMPEGTTAYFDQSMLDLVALA